MKRRLMKKTRKQSAVFLAVGLLTATPALAQGGSVVGMPGMNMPAPSAKAPVWRKAATKKTMRTHATTAAQGTGGAGMSSSIDLLDPMAQEASGTAWLPASSPMYGKMYMPNGNMLMLHGAAMPRYTDIGSKHGDRRFDAPNWEMGMFSHPLTADSQLGLRAMENAHCPDQERPGSPGNLGRHSRIIGCGWHRNGVDGACHFRCL